MGGYPVNIRDILLLLSIPAIGGGRVRRLLSVFPSAGAVIRAPLKRLVQVAGIDYRLAGRIRAGGDAGLVDRQLAALANRRIRYVTIWDDTYPPLLRRTTAPPVLLFYTGTLPEQWPAMIGIVGTRRPSAYGRTVTEKLTAALVEHDIAIVSGMARGIDTLAHTVTTRRGGQTYAILGNGVDVIYPPENRSLYDQVKDNGAILSEYFIGAKPDAVNFPRRNRIISGMSLGVLVIEAGQKSGALITANFALEENREVFAVPGPVNSLRSEGPNRLIQQGAKLVITVDDILSEVSAKIPAATRRTQSPPPDLTARQHQLLACLEDEPCHIDQLVLTMDQSPASLLAELLTMELKGLVKQLSGKLFIRI